MLWPGSTTTDRIELKRMMDPEPCTLMIRPADWMTCAPPLRLRPRTRSISSSV